MKPTRTRLPALALALATALPALCNVQGDLVVKQSGQKYTGNIRWKNVEKKYEVTQDSRTMSFDPALVTVVVKRPPQLVKAEEDLREGRYAAVTAGLTSIYENHIMFPYDEEIASLLAQSLTAQNKAAEAVKVCETLANIRPEAAYRGKMVAAYWAALLKTNSRESTLKGLIEKAVKTGDIPAMAQACVLRGDMFLNISNPSRVDHQNALLDGYLRVIFLYAREARDVLPEALYKAANSFDKIGQSARAQQYRAQLQKEFPNSPWAKK
ncbi:MAG: hypothetical protein FWF96_07825 [Kiritimatiellaeota bacterium]|nr:hypothetical protein [Kiritimatiellota bacterium]